MKRPDLLLKNVKFTDLSMAVWLELPHKFVQAAAFEYIVCSKFQPV